MHFMHRFLDINFNFRAIYRALNQIRFGSDSELRLQVRVKNFGLLIILFLNCLSLHHDFVSERSRRNLETNFRNQQ